MSQQQKPIVLNFMTCCFVEIDEKQNITLLSDVGKMRVEYDKHLFTVETDVIELTDASLKRGWNGKNITRIRLVMTKDVAKGSTKVTIQK